jgi:hypothetical protein
LEQHSRPNYQVYPSQLFMRKFALLLAALFVTIFSLIQFASALAVSTVPQGGTGWGALKAGTILLGNGTTRLGTTTAATQGYQLVYLGTAPTWVATTTYSSPLSWSNGAVSLSTSGTWSGNAGTATALAANGTNCSAGNYPLGVDATGNAESCTAASTGTLTAVTGTWPILSSGGTTPIISWAGIATSSGLTAGRVHYSTGVNTFADIATSSEICTAPLMCAAHTVLSGGGAISWLGLATTSQPSSSNVLVSNGTSGVYGVATSSHGVTAPITFSGTLGAQLGGANGSFGCPTCNTSNATVSSVGLSDANSTLTIGGTPITTSGTLTATLNLAHANAWTGQQTFNTSAPIFGTLTGLLQGNGASAVSAVTGVAGQFPYYNGTNTLLATSTLFISTASNIGIGTTSPATTFSVAGNGYFTGGIGLGAVNTTANSITVTNPANTILAATLTPTNISVFGVDSGISFNNGSSINRSAADGGLVITGGQANITVTPAANTIFSSGNVGIGTTTPLAMLQVTNLSANATTSLQFGKPGQNKGTCLTYYDTAGTPVYGFIAAGATTFTYTTSKPSGCQN